jgi:hypothetical protein
MRWNSSNLMKRVQSLIGGSSSHPVQQMESSLDSIRQAMLEAMGTTGASRYPVVQLRVSYANDIQDLWYLRGDVMAVLAAIEGEGSARSKLDRISEMFRGLLPRSMNSRPSPLVA